MDETMEANAQKNKFLIDGFPRNEDNLQGWNKTMDGKADVLFVLFFDCDNEVITISRHLQLSSVLYEERQWKMFHCSISIFPSIHFDTNYVLIGSFPQ